MNTTVSTVCLQFIAPVCANMLAIPEKRTKKRNTQKYCKTAELHHHIMPWFCMLLKEEIPQSAYVPKKCQLQLPNSIYSKVLTCVLHYHKHFVKSKWLSVHLVRNFQSILFVGSQHNLANPEYVLSLI